MVVDVAGGIVAANPLAAALTGDFSGASRRERNIAWRHFTGKASRIVRSPEHEAAAEEDWSPSCTTRTAATRPTRN